MRATSGCARSLTLLAKRQEHVLQHSPSSHPLLLPWPPQAVHPSRPSWACLYAQHRQRAVWETEGQGDGEEHSQGVRHEPARWVRWRLRNERCGVGRVLCLAAVACVRPPQRALRCREAAVTFAPTSNPTFHTIILRQLWCAHRKEAPVVLMALSCCRPSLPLVLPLPAWMLLVAHRPGLCWSDAMLQIGLEDCDQTTTEPHPRH